MSGARHRILSARVPLWPDEPAYGLANRLARRNGVSSLVSFGGDHAIPFREIIRGLRNAEIADLSGAKIGLLDASTFRIDGEQIHLNGEVLPVEEWSYTSLRVCPSCIRSDLARDDSRKQFLPHVRSWWNLSAVSVCPIHRQVLLDRHPDCPDARVNHLSLDVRFVAQGKGDFSTLASEPVDDVRAESYILSRLGFMPRIKNTLLDGLPLREAIRLMDRMGAVAGHAARAFTSIGGDVSRRDQLGAGYGAFAEGAVGFSSFLDGLVAATRIESIKKSQRFSYAGAVIKWMADDLRDAIHEPIRELVLEHARENIPIFEFEEPVESRVWPFSVRAINMEPE
jgi:TniQ